MTTAECFPMTITTTLKTWADALRASHDRVLAAAEIGRHRAALLAHAAAGRIVAAWTPSGAPARVAVRCRGALADDGSALHSPESAFPPGPARACRLHRRRVVHLHAPKAAPPGARSQPRPSEPDRSVAALALGGGGADADRWLGGVDGDLARRQAAFDALGSRRLALAHRSVHGPHGRARPASR